MGAYKILASKYRILHLYGMVSGLASIGTSAARDDTWSATYVADQMMAMSLEDPEKPIVLFIDSPGGVIREGMALIDVMTTVEAPVWTVGKTSYSMAAIILAAGEPGHRYIIEHGDTMLHLPSGHASGDSKQIKIQNEQFEKIKNSLVDFVISRGVKRSNEEILEDIDREFYLDANQTIDYGLADKLWTTQEFKTIREHKTLV
jgi:ATP-dependent Clp protease protease subunit